MIVVAVDFDDTIMYKENYQWKLFPNIRQSLINLCKQEFVFILNTCRDDMALVEAVNFIRDNKLPINIPLDRRKVQADIYIDDKNLDCNGIDWKEIEQKLLRYKEDTLCMK